ncbi:Clp protease N-terminal domain-containing protein [Isosphaeraceae bacterium EP7]
MDKLLSDRSRAALEKARDEASRLHHEYIGTEHILLGIAGEAGGNASATLASFGVTLDRIRVAVEALIGIGPPGASPDDRGVTPRAKQVIGFAQEEVDRSGHKEVDPEHLLIGLTREVHGVAAQVLRNLQAPPEDVVEKVSELLGRGDEGEPHSG